MLDKKFLINNKELVLESMKKRGYENYEKEFLWFEKNYDNYKKNLTEIEKLKAEQNAIKGFNERAIEIKQSISNLEEVLKKTEEILDEWLFNQPNIISNDVPFGKSADDNKVIFQTEIKTKDSKPHFELIDNLVMKEESVQVSGARFNIFKKELSKLQRALVNFMIDHNEKHGYEEYSIPYIVKEQSFFGTGQFPKFKLEAFETNDNNWLISTGEVSLVNMFANYTFKKEYLPKLTMTYSPCFRKEAGSAGKDTKGLIRLHQFHKVELVTICTEEMAEELHQKKLQTACKILDLLEIPYRILLLCSQDMGFTAKKQYDIEIWMPGMNRFLEIASCSQCGTFQAMRANIKYKEDGKNKFAHTLNGSSLPIERLIAGIVENHYENGVIKIPAVLKKYYDMDNIFVG